MATHNNTYSRFVAWLKVLLPVIALVLLSTMFFFSKSIDPSRALQYADVDVEDLASNQRISGPRFSGVTRDGAAISFSAKTAQPDPDNPANYTITQIKAQIETPDGGFVDLLATEAHVNGDQNLLELTGGVSLNTSTDYTIKTEILRATMDNTWFESDGMVTAEGPMGHIQAGKIVMTRQPGEAGAYLLVFKDGVEMVYNPQSSQEP